jgi:hypothetical protein
MELSPSLIPASWCTGYMPKMLQLLLSQGGNQVYKRSMSMLCEPNATKSPSLYLHISVSSKESRVIEEKVGEKYSASGVLLSEQATKSWASDVVCWMIRSLHC